MLSLAIMQTITACVVDYYPNCHGHKIGKNNEAISVGGHEEGWGKIFYQMPEHCEPPQGGATASNDVVFSQLAE
jgi:hypothetical protein